MIQQANPTKKSEYAGQYQVFEQRYANLKSEGLVVQEQLSAFESELKSLKINFTI